MHFQYVQPSSFLTQYIKHYWILEAEHADGEVCERIIPTGNIELMFHYKNTFVVKNQAQRIYQPQSLVSGISSNYSDIATRGESGVVAVTFYPHGAAHFLRFPLSEIENNSIDLNDIFDTDIKAIEEQICLAKTLSERIGIIESFLLRCFKSIDTNDLLLIKAGVAYINQSKGQISATTLSEKLFSTNKTLERKFSRILGKSPKQFIRIVRFQGIIQSFSHSENKHLTQVAIENGYFDQAHFINDFKSLSGYTPKEFLSLGQCHADYFE